MTSAKSKTFYTVQPFVLGKRGRLTPGQPQPSKSEEEAEAKAQRRVESGSAVGAIAFSQTGVPDEGDMDEPVMLASFGQVPEEA